MLGKVFLLGFVSTQVKSATPVIPLVPETVFTTSLSPIFHVWCMSSTVIPWSSANLFSLESSL